MHGGNLKSNWWWEADKSTAFISDLRVNWNLNLIFLWFMAWTEKTSYLLLLPKHFLWKQVAQLLPRNILDHCHYPMTYQTLKRNKNNTYIKSASSSSSSGSLRVRCFPFSLVLKMELVPPSLLRSSNVPSSFWSVFQCLSWQSISVHPLYVL